MGGCARSCKSGGARADKPPRTGASHGPAEARFGLALIHGPHHSWMNSSHARRTWALNSLFGRPRILLPPWCLPILCLFSKAAPLCSTVELGLGPDSPLSVKYALENA